MKMIAPDRGGSDRLMREGYFQTWLAQSRNQFTRLSALAGGMQVADNASYPQLSAPLFATPRFFG
jgi:hypothetical protein